MMMMMMMTTTMMIFSKIASPTNKNSGLLPLLVGPSRKFKGRPWLKFPVRFLKVSLPYSTTQTLPFFSWGDPQAEVIKFEVAPPKESDGGTELLQVVSIFWWWTAGMIGMNSSQLSFGEGKTWLKVQGFWTSTVALQIGDFFSHPEGSGPSQAPPFSLVKVWVNSYQVGRFWKWFTVP